MSKFSNVYYQGALDTLLERKGVITLTGEELKLLDVLENRTEKEVTRFLQENSSFNFLIIALQR